MKRPLYSYIKTVSLCFLFVVIAGYSSYQMRNMISGPQFSIDTPASGTIVTSPIVTLSGVAHNSVSIALNDGEITMDEHGNFSEPLLLSPGYNILKIEARDRFSNTHQQLIKLVYRQPPSALAPSAIATSTRTTI